MNRKTFIGTCIVGIASIFVPKAKVRGQPIKMETAYFTPRKAWHIVTFRAKYFKQERWDIFQRACEVFIANAGLSNYDEIVIISGKDYNRLIGKA